MFLVVTLCIHGNSFLLVKLFSSYLFVKISFAIFSNFSLIFFFTRTFINYAFIRRLVGKSWFWFIKKILISDEYFFGTSQSSRFSLSLWNYYSSLNPLFFFFFFIELSPSFSSSHFWIKVWIHICIYIINILILLSIYDNIISRVYYINAILITKINIYQLLI